MSHLQVKTITFKIVTKADQPLTIEPHVMAALMDALDTAVQQLVDLRYGPRLDDKRHEYVGVML